MCVRRFLAAPRIALAALVAAWPAAAGAQSGTPDAASPLALARLTQPIVFDGMPNEAAWDAAQPLPMTMFTPTFGGELTERTEVLVAYDDSHLYVGGRLYDSHPERIRTNTLYRDGYSGDDILAIVLDTYNDYETASWFVVNPAGNRTDRAVSNDGEFAGGFPMNPDWNTHWDAETRQTDQGWFAEMRIPFSSLGFQVRDDRVIMGMIVYRVIARKNERQLFPAIPPNWDLAFAKPSRARRVVLQGVESERPIYVTPYGLGGMDRRPTLNGSGTAYEFEQGFTREAGLDVRWALTDNLSLDLTANTDFAQVEADDQQVNLTRFSLFFPEKRQFFQERAAIFEFNTGERSRLFHSRRIGLVDGEPIRLLGGARLAGRLGSWDVGLLDMQTAQASGRASENFGVLRLRRKVLNDYSTVGGMVTSRMTTDGTYNVAAGLDAVIRPVGDEYVTLKWAQTFATGIDGSPVDLAASRILVGWERRDDIGFSYSAEFLRSGADYDPGMGFTLRSDFTSLEARPQYQWLFGEGSPIHTISVGAPSQSFWRNADRSVETASVEPQLRFTLKSGEEIRLSVRNSYESIRDTFEISGGAPVTPGNYWFHQAELDLMAARSASFRPSAQVSAGSFFDGTRASLQARPAWNPSRHVEIGVDYEFNAVRFPDRDVALDLHVARVRLALALNVHLSLATFVQYNSATDDASVNARFRYHIREGNDLWIVYNEAVNTDRFVPGGPNLPVSQGRALMVKYTHTLVW